MSSWASPAQTPWLVLPPESGEAELIFHQPGGDIWNELPLMKLDDDDGVYFVGSSHGWLFGRKRGANDVFMLNPFSGECINLPDLSPKLDISRVALSYSPDDDGLSFSVTVVYGRKRNLAFWSPAASAWTVVASDVEDVVYSTTLGVWLSIPTACLTELDDYYIRKRNEEFCAEEISIPSPMMFSEAVDLDMFKDDDSIRHLSVKYDGVMYPGPELLWLEMFKGSCLRFKYLILYEESVFVVVRHVAPRMAPYGRVVPDLHISIYKGLDDSFYYRTIDFDVYEVRRTSRDNEGKTFLAHMDAASLEGLGLAMFVGANKSFAMPASESPWLKPNCIYFSDEYRLMSKAGFFPDCPYVGHDNGIYNYQKRSLSQCCGCGSTCPLNPPEIYDIYKIYPPPMWCISEGSISTEELGVVSKRPRTWN